MAGRSPLPPAFEPLEQRTLLAVIYWDGGGDGASWHDPANWQGDVLPGPLDRVIINRAGSNPTVVYSTGETNIFDLRSEENLTITGGRLVAFATNWMAGALTVEGGTLLVGIEWQQLGPVTLSGGAIDGIGAFVVKSTMTWTGGRLGDQAVPSGRVQIAPAATLTINGNVTLDRVLVNAGTIDWQSGTLSIRRGQLFNMTGRTINMPAGASLPATITPVGLIVNRGTISVTDGAEIGVRFVQPPGGATTVAAGVLTLRRGGSIDGTLTTAPGAEFRCAGDLLQVSLNVLPGAAATFGGPVSVTGGRLGLKPAGLTLDDLSVSGGSLTLFEDTTIGAATLSGGAIGGPGDILVTGSLAWNRGRFVASMGELIVPPGAALSMGSTQSLSTWRPVRILGTATWTDGNLHVFSTFHVEAGGMLNVSAMNREMVLESTAGALIVDGTLTRMGPGQTQVNTRFFSMMGAVLNTGASVQQGALIIGGRAAIAGTYSVASNAFLGLGARGQVMTIDPGTLFTGPGTVQVIFSAGTVALAGTIETQRLEIHGRADLDGATITSSVLELMPTGFIVGNLDLVITASFIWSGGGFAGAGRTIIPSGSTATLTVDTLYQVQRPFINRGTMTLAAGRIEIAGSLRHESGAAFNMLPAGPSSVPIVRTLGGGSMTLLAGATLNVSAGVIEIQGSSPVALLGTVNKTGAGAFTFTAQTAAGRADGQVNIAAGTVRMTRGTHAGQFVIAAGAFLNAAGAPGSDIVFTPASSISGAGVFMNSSANVQVQGTLDVARLEVRAGAVAGTVSLLLGGLKRAGTVVLRGDTLLIGSAVALQVTTAFVHESGRLQMRLAGPAQGQHARVTVAGEFNLVTAPPVALEVIYWSGFAPSLGQTFNLVTSASRSGQFGTVVVPPPPPGLIADLDYLPGIVRLTMVPA